MALGVNVRSPPLADLTVGGDPGSMPGNPDTYIREALGEHGVTVHALTVHAYSPKAFGNLVADAQTNFGRLRIIYDRGFFLEGDAEWAGPPCDQLVEALEVQKRLSAR